MLRKILITIFFLIVSSANFSYAGSKLQRAPPPLPDAPAEPVPDAPPPDNSEYGEIAACGDGVTDCISVFPSQKYHEQYLVLKNISPTFGGIINVLKNTEPSFSIEARECGVINSWYNPQFKKITLCYEYLEDGDNFIYDHYSNQPPQVIANLQTGIFISVLMHEYGHAVIDIENMPVLGNEEDAADKISTIVLLEITKKNPNLGKLSIEGDLAYQSWIKTDLTNKRLFADEHPLNEQRVFNKVCLAYGSNPELFADTAVRFGLPEKRAARCASEYIKTKSAIDKLSK